MLYIPIIGTMAFGVIVGWFVYYINRCRKAEFQLTDVTSLLSIIGGGASTAIFGPAKSPELFGAYGIGLFVGFFGYFAALVVLIHKSGGAFKWTWFLDGRRKDPEAGESYSGDNPPDRGPKPAESTDTRLTALENSVRCLEYPANRDGKPVS